MSISSYSSSSQISSTRLTIILALCSSLLSPYHAQNCASIIILSLDIVSDDTMTTSYIVSLILALFQIVLIFNVFNSLRYF